MENKFLVSFDEAGAQKQMQLLFAGQNQLQAVITAFGNLGENINVANATELQRIITVPFGSGLLSANEPEIKALYLEKMLPDGKLAWMRVSPDLIQLPPLDEIESSIRSTQLQAITFLSNGYFEVSAGKVIIAKTAKARIIENFKVWAETEDEKARYHAAKALSDALNGLCDLLPEIPGFESKLVTLGDIESFIATDEDGKFIPNDSYIKYGRRDYVMRTQTFTHTTGKEKSGGETPEYDQYIGGLLADAGTVEKSDHDFKLENLYESE